MKKTMFAALLALAACGGEPGDEEPAMAIGFQMHALQCDVPGMMARLEVSGVPGICPLQVNADRTVTGVCKPVPTGEIRDFRLIYFYFPTPTTELELATVIARLDLRNETREQVRVEFPADRVFTELDADADTRSNIEEFCMGTDPLRAD
ncbi:MAG: hypothetical protein RMA76_37970 [Deltaproteobacteria bacterium]|jgi:hypothetical protein